MELISVEFAIHCKYNGFTSMVVKVENIFFHVTSDVYIRGSFSS